MNSNAFERSMRELEYFHNLRVLPNTWIILRVDGRGFSQFTTAFEKPFDEDFHQYMKTTAKELLIQLQGLYAYTESDEISILLPLNWDLFNRKVEKLVSISAGIASSAFTDYCKKTAHFDGRIWVGPTDEFVIDYFRWRQADAARCCLNSEVYWALRREGLSAHKASKMLERKNAAFKNELLFQKGINFNDLPFWKRRGVGIRWISFLKTGYNPKTERKVSTPRRRLETNCHLPIKDEYRNYIMNILKEGNTQ